ncbi:hypothetical protein HDU79_009804 [Rhizoclosmatium sp. JEL0117]|nr:hypothetical protein HDU79_009804 [Rhizoclosmatium sp. JEL0117]
MQLLAIIASASLLASAAAVTTCTTTIAPKPAATTPCTTTTAVAPKPATTTPCTTTSAATIVATTKPVAPVVPATSAKPKTQLYSGAESVVVIGSALAAFAMVL